MSLVTQQDDTPIIAKRALYSPDRDHQWEATRDNYEPGNPIGFGATADAAIENLQTEEEWRAA